jgi:integrase
MAWTKTWTQAGLTEPSGFEMKLTNAGLKKLLEKPGRYGDGDGLYFRTIGGNRAYWAYRYRADGKEREVSIGPFPEVSLADARAKHMELRKRVVVDKADPLAERHAAKQAAPVAPKTKPTFGEFADAHIRTMSGQWRNPKHRAQWTMTLTKYCAPIRPTPVDQIDTEGVLRVLTPIWTKTPETASRLRGRIETILNAAKAQGHRSGENPAAWRGHLAHLLPNPKKVGQRRGHHAAMRYDDVPAFMATLKAAPGEAAKALTFAILTAARSGEVFGATWDEINLDEGVWVAPPDRMKARREHRVPLSAPAIDILRGQLAERGKNPHVFPGARQNQPLSITALAMAMRRLGAGSFTPHGFRSAFRDWAGDKTSFSREVAEAALAHVIGDESERAYRRGDALDKRRVLMNAWADFCFPTGDNVIMFPAKAG